MEVTNFRYLFSQESFLRERGESIKQLEVDIKNYICYYNNKRISKLLKGMSPIEYRAQYYK